MSGNPAPRRVLLFFIDGVGVGADDPDVNAIATGEFPTLRLTQTRTPESRIGPPGMSWGLDASMGIRGLPQSATGQTSILTGINAPRAMGRHISGFPGPSLKRILFEHSILKKVRSVGRSATFLNAFRPEYFTTPEAHRRLSATSLATLASGAPFRDWRDLLEERAVTHDLTHWRVRERGYDLPDRTPELAGEIIAREAMRNDFSLFEYFETDRAGHAQDRGFAMHCLRDLDRALQTVLSRIDLTTVTIVVASDHGNLEDSRTKSHTTNPALFMAWGPGANGDGMEGGAQEPRSLSDLAPFMLGAIGVTSAA